MNIWDLYKSSGLTNSPQSSPSPSKVSFSFSEISIFSDLLDRMAPRIKLEDKLEGIENFLAWKYMVGLILKENGFEKYIKDEVAEPK